MVKTAGAVMAGLSCAFLGIRMRVTMKRRVKSLGDICASLTALETEIGFSVNRLKTALARSDRSGLFTLAADKMSDKSTETAWSEAVREMSEELCLTDGDCEILLMLGKNMGKTDSDDQIKSIRYVRSLLETNEKQAGEELARCGKLYSGGGILIGVMVVIVMM